MLYIYNENFSFVPRLKSFIKKLIGMGVRGPRMVEQSLFLGLQELGEKFILNSKTLEPGSTVYVLSGTKTLSWAIQQKRKGLIQKLVAGPNIVVTPFDNQKLVLAPEIDLFIVPAEWSKNWWSHLTPEFKEKLRVWPAGVVDNGLSLRDRKQVLVFQKNGSEGLLKLVTESLSDFGFKFIVVKYGEFKHVEYLDLLKNIQFVVYLSQSETQGIALHESWMSNVPTLVWNRGYMQYKNFKWYDAKISAPYLNSATGIFFEGEGDLKEKLQLFIKNYAQFEPRAYSLENFTNKVTAKNLLKIIQEVNHEN